MLQTIYIMWLRELKKFWRSPSRMIGALGQPILFLLALGYGLGSVFQAAGQGSYVQFLVPGIIGMAIIFASIFNGMQIIWDRQFGFLKETLGRTGFAHCHHARPHVWRSDRGNRARLHRLRADAAFRVSPVELGPDCSGDHRHVFDRITVFGARHHGRFVCQGHARLSAGHELAGNADVLSVRCAVPAHERSISFSGRCRQSIRCRTASTAYVRSSSTFRTLASRPTRQWP